MKIKSILSVMICTALMSFSGNANAEIIVSIADVETVADSLVSVGVSAHSTNGEQLFSYDTPLDFGGDNGGLPAGLTFIDADVGLAFDFFDGDQVSSEEDLLVSAGQFATAQTISADGSMPTLLYTLNFAVDSSVVAGQVFDIEIIDGNGFAGGVPSFTVVDQNFAEVAGTPVNGSITITAVPEPATASLIGLVALAGLSMRRRR